MWPKSCYQLVCVHHKLSRNTVDITSREMKADQCTVFTSMTLVKINWALNFCSEVLSKNAILPPVNHSNSSTVFVVPLPLIHNLSIPRRRERAGLMVIFLLGAITIAVSTARFIAMLLVSNNIAICKITAPHLFRKLLNIVDILATAEFTVSIIILSLISLRPLLRKIHRWTSNASSNSPFSRGNQTGVTSGKRQKPHTNTRQKGSHVIYAKGGNGRNIYGSEVELTEHEPGTIYKTEEISVTSARDPQLGDDDDKTSSS